MVYMYFICGSLAALWVAASLANTKFIELPAQSNRVGYIDGLRGYLALSVMCHHFFIFMNVAQGGGWNAPSSNLIENFGQGGVTVFFMITGVLFYSKICDNPLRVDWPKMYISRFFRLTPLLVFVSMVMFTIAAIKTSYSGQINPVNELFFILEWIFCLGMPNLLHFDHTGMIVAYVTWSLRYEWMFYLSLPLLGLAFSSLSKWTGRRNTLILLLSLSYLLQQFRPGFASGAANFAPLFLTGMLAAELRKEQGVTRLLRGRAASSIGLAALVFEALFFHGAFGVLQYMLLAVFFLPVVCGNDYFGVLSRKVSIFLGEISYSVYLVHGVILFVIFELSKIPVLMLERRLDLAMLFPLPAVLCVIAPAITHKFIELPGISMGRTCTAKWFGMVERYRQARVDT